MNILHGLAEADAIRGGVVSIGNFDGVHRGHRSILAMLTRRAKECSARSIVLTFDPHPIALLRPHQTPPPLSTTERKLELLAGCGVECALVYATDRALLDLTPREFFERIILDQLAARGLVEGPNFFFGHDRAGNVETLRGFCEARGLFLDVVPPLEVGGLIVSSSEVRRLIRTGEVRVATDLLGAPYRVRGRVVAGAQRGRTLGFPTANLEQVRTLLPADGVYAGRALVGETWYAAAINVGPNPTFAEQERKFEVHLIDFKADLYGLDLDVELLDRLRDTQPFAGLEALKQQLVRDVAQARAVVELADG